MPHTWLCVQKPLGLPACRDGPVTCPTKPAALATTDRWRHGPPVAGQFRLDLGPGGSSFSTGVQRALPPACWVPLPGLCSLDPPTLGIGPEQVDLPGTAPQPAIGLAPALPCPVYAHSGPHHPILWSPQVSPVGWNRQAGVGWEGAKVGEGSQELKHGRCWNSGCNGAR